MKSSAKYFHLVVGP